MTYDKHHSVWMVRLAAEVLLQADVFMLGRQD